MDAKSVVSKAAATAVSIDRETEEIERELATVEATLPTFFGVEVEASNQMQARVRRLYSDLRMGGLGLRRLSLEPLKWTHATTGFPQLAIYSLTGGPTMEIRPTGVNRPAPLPSEILHLYDPVTARLSTLSKILISTFKGVIPAEAREQIQAARALFMPEHLYLIAEAEWTQHAFVPVSRDPLAVGWDGQDLWLIAQFNLTSVEKYIAAEFTK